MLKKARSVSLKDLVKLLANELDATIEGAKMLLAKAFGLACPAQILLEELATTVNAAKRALIMYGKKQEYLIQCHCC